MDNDLLSIREVARMLGVSKQAVHRWIKRGVLKYKRIRIGKQTRLFVFRDAIEKILESKQN